MADVPACETCRWWELEVGVIQPGICRRFPPHPRGHDGERLLRTLLADWCGEWSAAVALGAEVGARESAAAAEYKRRHRA